MSVREHEVQQRLQLWLLVVSMVLAVSLFFYFGKRYPVGGSIKETEDMAAICETETSTFFLKEMAALENDLRERGFTGW